MLRLADSPAAGGRGGGQEGGHLSPFLSFGGRAQELNQLTPPSDQFTPPAPAGRGSAPGQTVQARTSHCPDSDLSQKGRQKERRRGLWKERDFSGRSSPLAEKFFEINNVGVVW